MYLLLKPKYQPTKTVRYTNRIWHKSIKSDSCTSGKLGLQQLRYPAIPAPYSVHEIFYISHWLTCPYLNDLHAGRSLLFSFVILKKWLD